MHLRNRRPCPCGNNCKGRLRHQHRRPRQKTQLSTGELINVSKQDDQGAKCSLTACRMGEVKGTPPARFRDLQYLLWLVNADLFMEYASAGLASKWLFDVMMLGKDLIFYGETDVVYRIDRDMQRLWRIEKEKDQTTVPFYHARLRVYSWMSGSITTNMYQFHQHTCGVKQQAAEITRYMCSVR